MGPYVNQLVNLSACFSTSSRHSQGVRVQHPAPNFQGQAVVNGQFKEIKLDDFKGKYLVLFFYPLDFTFVCPTEIIALVIELPNLMPLMRKSLGYPLTHISVIWPGLISP